MYPSHLSPIELYDNKLYYNKLKCNRYWIVSDNG